MALTKVAAGDKARSILSNGHFAIPGCADVWVRVPHTGQRLRLYATAGRLPHGEMVRQLSNALLDIDRYGDACCEMDT